MLILSSPVSEFLLDAYRELKSDLRERADALAVLERQARAETQELVEGERLRDQLAEILLAGGIDSERLRD